MQKTLAKSITFEGRGLHSNAEVRMVLLPAPPDSGIVFERQDLVELSPDAREIPALWSNACSSTLCTTLRNSAGAHISTVEHLMAALAGSGIHNLRVAIDGPEVPILDGSSRDFVRDIFKTGLTAQNAPVRAIKVLKPVIVENGAAIARLDPADHLEIRFLIEFEDEAIGRQDKRLEMTNGNFIRELSNSRTFCSKRAVSDMRKKGLAKGGSLENALVFDGAKVLTPSGQRHPDEPVRHKMLDAMGDLYLASAPLIGAYTSHKGGHATTIALLKALMTNSSAWCFIECSEERVAMLPGAGVSAKDIAAACT